MTDKDLLKRRIDTYNNLISRLDRITSANYMHIVAGMRCTLKAMIDNNLAIIDSTQENPCNGCTNRKGCITCENGELRETMQEEPVSDELEKVVEEIVDPTVLNAYGVKEIANRLRRTMIDSASEELEEEIEKYFNGWFDDDEYNEAVKPDYTAASVEDCKDIARHFAEWQKEQDIKK